MIIDKFPATRCQTLGIKPYLMRNPGNNIMVACVTDNFDFVINVQIM